METLRVLIVSTLLDLSQLPFLNVTICAFAGRGRLAELYPFQGYRNAWRAIINQEGIEGLMTVSK